MPWPAIRSRRDLNLWMLGWLQALHLLNFSVMMPLGPQFTRIWHLSPWEVGILAAAYPLAAGLTGLATLMGTRHLPGKRSVWVPGSGFVLALAWSACMDDYHWLLAGRILAGVMGGLLCAWLPDVISRIAPAEKRNQSLRQALSEQPFWIVSLGLPVLLGIAWKWDWAASFQLLAAASLITVGVLAFQLPEIRRGMSEKRTHIRSMIILLRHSGYRSVFIMSCALTASAAVLITFFSGIMVINMDLGEGRLALLFLAGGVTTLLALPLAEKMAAHLDPWRLFIGMGAASASAILILVAVPLRHTTWAAGAGVAFMVTNVLRFVPAGRLWQKHLKPRHAERFSALQAVLQQTVAACAMIVAGSLMERSGHGPLEGYDRLAMVALAALALATGLAWWEFKRNKGAL